MGSNSNVLDLLDNLGISPIFNVEDLILHQGTFEHPSLPLSACVGTQVTRFPHFLMSRNDIKAVLDAKFLSSHSGFHHLVQ